MFGASGVRVLGFRVKRFWGLGWWVLVFRAWVLGFRVLVELGCKV